MKKENIINNRRIGKFKYEINTRFRDEKRDITITDKEYRPIIKKNGKKENIKWYKYTCNKCGWTYGYRDWETDRKSTRLNSSHSAKSRMPSSA